MVNVVPFLFVLKEEDFLLNEIKAKDAEKWVFSSIVYLLMP